MTPYKCLFIGGPLHLQVKPISHMRPTYKHRERTPALVEYAYENHALQEFATGRRYLLYVYGPLPEVDEIVQMIRQRNLPSIHPAEPANDQ